ncbi:MAG: Exodeoxyribonuclease III [Candidatus Saccharibacteria bacterium GW2011_GWA2_46_10]|nr:MAG: Exodeoxyribonuclease III [Candidatus Saccharibacteria bacterium GW2011_GWA2_46_10]
MKVITWNVNGLRNVYKKRFLAFVAKIRPDILCLQEIKIQPEQLQKLTIPRGYHLFYDCAQKPGYSGVVVLTKEKPKRVEDKTGSVRFDQEGRFLKLTFPEFALINFYLPHGGRLKENLGYKLEVYRYFLKRLAKIKNRPLILAGDFNIAHREIDLARPKQNQNNIMFTSEERKQLDSLVDLGFVDTFRVFHQDGGHYTWWPYFANARERNLGWRIDYCFISQPLLSELKGAFILPRVGGSDHCPAGIELKPF